MGMTQYRVKGVVEEAICSMISDVFSVVNKYLYMALSL